MTYPTTTGFVAHSQTSQQSAQQLDDSGNAETYNRIILDFLIAQGTHGATADEVRLYMAPQYPHLHNGTVNGRLSTLWRDNHVAKTTSRRTTEANRPAHVYVHAQYQSQVACEPRYWEVMGGDLIAAQRALKYILSTYTHSDTGFVSSHLTKTDLKGLKSLCEQAGVSSQLFDTPI